MWKKILLTSLCLTACADRPVSSDCDGMCQPAGPVFPGVGECVTPPPSGAPQIYKVVPTWCTSRCWTLTLYRNETFIELRSHEGGEFLGLATGTLSDLASEELDQLLDDAVDLGELPGDVPIDSPLVELSLPGLSLVYADDYPPTGLVQLDAFLAKILDDMSQCRPTTQITPDHDCEPLNWFPE